MSVYGTISGFNSSEIIEIQGDTVRDAFRKLGAKNKQYIQYRLEDYLPEKGKAKYLKSALAQLRNIEGLAKKGVFMIDGVNWLTRYLQAFYGSCEGAGISRAEGAVLQSEGAVGCQSLLVQDKKTGEIRLIHTEEDSEIDTGGKFKYPFKVVKIRLEDKEVSFFSYPDIFGWGYSVGINESAGFVQVVDDLSPRTKYNRGYFWTMAVTFMTMDSGSVKTAGKIMKKLAASGIVFNGGYSVHMAQLDGKPTLNSFECIHREVKHLSPKVTRDRVVIGQSNVALNPTLQKYCMAGWPKKGDSWSLTAANLYTEMLGRTERLLKFGKEAKWLGLSAKNSIKYGLKLLADPRGDVGLYKDGYLMTGLPSFWTYAHFAAYLGGDKIEFYLGKNLPKPIRGSEYSVKYFKGYKFVGKKIWLEGKRAYNKFVNG
jgi:hypothetical protein